MRDEENQLASTEGSELQPNFEGPPTSSSISFYHARLKDTWGSIQYHSRMQESMHYHEREHALP